MQVEVWLYGPLARYRGGNSYAQVLLDLPEGTTIGQLLEKLGIPNEERGITFLNRQLSAMPGLYPDLEVELHDGDRVGIFHKRSMWPFQYRYGAAAHESMRKALQGREKGGIHHSYRT